MRKWPRLDKMPMLPALGDKKYERALAPLQERILHIQMSDIR